MPAQIDLTNDMMVQLLLFMKHHVVPKYREQLQAQFPSLRELVVDHQMRTSYGFMLLRAVRKERIGMFDAKEIESIFEPLGLWSKMTPTFFAVFWSLEISDIFHPEEQYQEEIRRQSKGQKRLR